MSTPKFQNATHFFGQYLHDLVVHAPPQYEVVCLRSTNAESQERLFSQAKHISLCATNWKPENVLPTILLSLQARQKKSEAQQSVQKQETIVSSLAKSLPPYPGTTISKLFKRGHSAGRHTCNKSVLSLSVVRMYGGHKLNLATSFLILTMTRIIGHHYYI